MFAEPAGDNGDLWVILERLKDCGSPRSERECTLVDEKRVLFVCMGVRLAKPNGILSKCTQCFMIGALCLVDLSLRTTH